jgi:hypothetical protein
MPLPTEAELAELARLQERFRGHWISRDVVPGRGVRYVAHSAQIGMHPHTVITPDLAELRDELNRGSRQALGQIWLMGTSW